MGGSNREGIAFAIETGESGLEKAGKWAAPTEKESLSRLKRKWRGRRLGRHGGSNREGIAFAIETGKLGDCQ